jgi:hypothetical protein
MLIVVGDNSQLKWGFDPFETELNTIKARGMMII